MVRYCHSLFSGRQKSFLTTRNLSWCTLNEQWRDFKIGVILVITSMVSWIIRYPPGLNIRSISAATSIISHLANQFHNTPPQVVHYLYEETTQNTLWICTIVKVNSVPRTQVSNEVTGMQKIVRSRVCIKRFTPIMVNTNQPSIENDR